jgi:hypothetical protein
VEGEHGKIVKKGNVSLLRSWPKMVIDRQKLFYWNVYLIISPNHFWLKTLEKCLGLWQTGLLVNGGQWSTILSVKLFCLSLAVAPIKL